MLHNFRRNATMGAIVPCFALQALLQLSQVLAAVSHWKDRSSRSRN
jgi:hypothetical protein